MSSTAKLNEEGLILEENIVDFVNSLINHPDYRRLGLYEGINIWDCNSLWLINQLAVEISIGRNKDETVDTIFS